MEDRKTLEELLDTEQFEEVHIVTQNRAHVFWDDRDVIRRCFKSIKPHHDNDSEFRIYKYNEDDNTIYYFGRYNANYDDIFTYNHVLTWGHGWKWTTRDSEIYMEKLAAGLLATVERIASSDSDYVLK